MTARAQASRERDILQHSRQRKPRHSPNKLTHRSGVDGNTVVLVVHGGPGDGHVRARADIERVRVMAAGGIAVGVVDGDVRHSQAFAAVDTDGLDGRVLDVQVGDGRGAG